MTHYDHGTREAEFLMRSAPDGVDYWLKKARTDRQRWIIRLFRPALRQFLDGFIAALDGYSRQPRHEVPAAPAGIVPVASTRGYSEAIKPEISPAPPIPPAAARETPERVETPPPPRFPADATPAPAPELPVIEVRPAPLPEPPEPASSGAPPMDFSRTVGYPEGDRAIGVFRLSAWSTGGASGRSGEPTLAPHRAPIEPVPPPPRQSPEIVWTNALEQARTVGVVDLTAYDTLEYLNDLRDVFDRRESLRNGVAGPTDRRAR